MRFPREAALASERDRRRRLRRHLSAGDAEAQAADERGADRPRRRGRSGAVERAETGE